MRRRLVSAFLADSIQHIHSLRASGVMSSHAVNTCGSDASAFFKSAGASCTTPLEIFLCDIDRLSFRGPPRWREDLLLSKGCWPFGDGQILTLRLTRRSIIIHCGRVKGYWKMTRRFIRLRNSGLTDALFAICNRMGILIRRPTSIRIPRSSKAAKPGATT